MLLSPKTLLLFWLPLSLLIFAMVFWQQSRQLVGRVAATANEQAPKFISLDNRGWYYQADGSLRYHITSSEQEHAAGGEITMSSIYMESFDADGELELIATAGSSTQQGQSIVLHNGVQAWRLNTAPLIELNTTTLNVQLAR